MASAAWTPVAEPASAAGWTPVAEAPKTEETRSSSLGELGKGLYEHTLGAIPGMVKGILPAAPDLHNETATAAMEHIKNGNYMDAAKALVSHGVESVPGGKVLTGILHNFMDEIQKAKDAHERGSNLEAAGHIGASLVPGAGQIADTAGGTEAKYDKFGNVTAEPVKPNLPKAIGQAAGDVLTLAGPAAIGKTAEATGIADKASEALQSSAERQYSSVLGATTKGNKIRSGKIVPELIDRGVTAMSVKGLNKQAVAQLQTVGEAIGDKWDNLPAGTKVPLKNIWEDIDSRAAEENSILDSSGNPIPKGPEAKKALSNIESLQEVLLDVSETNPKTGELEIPADKLRNLRQYWDEVSKHAGRFEGKDLSDQSIAAAHGMVADAARAQLASSLPDFAALNKEYSFWKNVGQVTSDTLERRQGQAKPLGRKMAGAAGAAVGFAEGGVHGAIIGKAALDSLEHIATSGGWNTVSAVMKSRLADAIAAGDQTAIGSIVGQISQASKAGEEVRQKPANVGNLMLQTR